MWHIQRQLSPFSAAHLVVTLPPLGFSYCIRSLVRPSNNSFLSCAHKPWATLISEERADISDEAAPRSEEGPVELPSSSSTLFSISDDPTPLQTATSVLLTGAITILLFRSIRRRAKRAKETKLRSSGEKKSLKEEAMESLKAVSLSPIKSKSTPSPVQAFLGAVSAAVIALILYKFTTTIEAALNRQTISDNYSVRQMTITIRTIINGLCYLATFVFGANALGLFLYSGQLALNSFTEGDNGDDESLLSSSQVTNPDISETPNSEKEQNLDDTEK